MKDLHLIMNELLNVVYDIDTFEYVISGLESIYEGGGTKEGKYIINCVKIQLNAIKEKINRITAELDKNM